MRILQKPDPDKYRQDPRRSYNMCTPAHILAIRRLLERPYWGRLWVFQELTLARHRILMCGRRVLNWESFAYFVDVVAHIGTGYSDSSSIIKAWRHLSPEAVGSLQAVPGCLAMLMVKYASQVTQAALLWDLMFALKHLGCADPRDKVYALLGVAAQTSATIEPDYTMSARSLAHAVLKHHHDVKPPQDTYEVAKQCEDLEVLLGLRPQEMLAMAGQHRRLSNAIFISSHAFRLGDAEGISLGWAVFQGHDAVVDLFKRKVAKEVTSRYLGEILDDAVYQGNEALVEVLLALKVIRTNHHLHMQVRQHGNGRRTSFLDTAVRYGHVGVARRLLETDHYDVNACLPRVFHHGRRVCPLHLAAQQCDIAMIKMLMNVQGINVHHRCGGKTLLEDAARPANVRCKPREDINTLKALLDPGNGSAFMGGVVAS
ncbi:hypothetical protein LTR27_008737 [Elasticomyces elasticus]|nr:hypothetical protein LTR27_008737 [Elasticomyces elasticus]